MTGPGFLRWGGGSDQEELGAEVLDVVGRERLQRLIVQAEPPAREEPGIPVEQAVRLVGAGLDVPTSVTDDEGAAVQNAQRIAAWHECPPPRRCPGLGAAGGLVSRRWPGVTPGPSSGGAVPPVAEGRQQPLPRLG